jgi:O-Antigen ligase
MSRSTSTVAPGFPPGWAPALVVLVSFGLFGPFLGAASRPMFVIACGAAGWFAWRRGPAAHVQSMLFLFVFTPFVRRLVDVVVGYDSSSLMIVGPLAAMLPPLVRLIDLPDSTATTRRLSPLFLVGGCVAYAAALTMFQGEWMNAARDSLRWLAPLFYAMILIDVADADEVLDAAADAFAIMLPIIGVYGIVQYVNPPDWDRYWMQYAPITSVGQPEPFGVRTFSTMNGPASFATFTATGLLLVWFRRRHWVLQMLALPAAFSLLLSLYRTAWISMLAAMLFCALFKSTRGRSAPLFFGIVAATVIAATLTPFGDVIAERLTTFSEGSQDGSARERLEQYVALWSLADSSVFGVGFTTADVGVAGSMAVDGTIIACWLCMGIVVGLLCLFGLVWTAAIAMGAAMRDQTAERVLLGAFGVFFLTQLPLAGIASGEAGYLFWTFMALALAPPAAMSQDARLPRRKLAPVYQSRRAEATNVGRRPG